MAIYNKAHNHISKKSNRIVILLRENKIIIFGSNCFTVI